MSSLQNVGFTLVELAVTTALFLSLLAIAVPNLLGIRERVEIRSIVNTVLADIRGQQLKAMLGDTEGRETTDLYGVHFETSSYTLFHGASYSPLESTNVVIPLSGNLRFDPVSFPNSAIIFNKGSGTVLGFDSQAHSIVLINPNTSETISVTFNTFGVVTGVQ